MINTAIQALNDMVNSFTRAAGAAERVLSLYDLTPDLDPVRIAAGKKCFPAARVGRERF